jgi:hypothetical protein
LESANSSFLRIPEGGVVESAFHLSIEKLKTSPFAAIFGCSTLFAWVYVPDKGAVTEKK